ncbi:homoserine dehydrogenase [Wenjunlia tyrosinilytica]|uniref:Homoserine dehydrogenase n=1 Tax=Wenjunlia tyrosinilytica TaxID=1544741 RepID=A0A917ZVW5_9ACTN|nr:homoserine dehydrogenase [Wenjunlia tyrosinilytica]GGO96485.1 homoserine dehydrogenase [Wenjunlia tyrosinilytica]
MTCYNLALIGFGGVSRAFLELLEKRNDELLEQFGFRLRVVAITDLRLGSIVAEEGVDVPDVLAADPGNGGFRRLGGSTDARNKWIIHHVPADIVVEATFTNPLDGEPALSHCRWALRSGKHLVTTNKGPVALAAAELKALAAQQGVAFEFEGAVMSGTPVIRLAERMFGGLEIQGFEGILNGTSNFVLGRMESGLDLGAAVREARSLGYAEADPTADLEGHDVRLKVAVLANELLGGALAPDDVATTGITALTPADTAKAAEQGLRWKLVGSARRTPGGGISAQVAPRALPLNHHLAGVSGAANAVSFDTDLLGPVTVSGPGAGRVETAYALLSDVIAIHESRTR